MENYILENHSAYNRFKTSQGLNQCENTTEPSEYITYVKIKKLFAKLSQEEIENLFDKEMSLIALARHREKLEQKLYNLHKWQLFKAFKMCKDYIYEAAIYVIGCKKLDNEETINEPNL